MNSSMPRRDRRSLPGLGLVALLGVVGCGSTTPGLDDESNLESALQDAPLEVRFLGVGGFLMRHGDSAIMTPPMYSNPGMLATTVGWAHANPERIERFSEGVPFEDVRGILVGHAHYDHLMDVPYLWPKTDNAKIFANKTARHLLAAYAPDRGPQCGDEDPTDVHIPRDRVVQLDDPLGTDATNYVDYRMCPEQFDGQGDISGSWVYIEGTHVRFRALCSHHPDQFGPIHFGGGSIGADLCTPPNKAAAWKEGATLAYLIDFLDPGTDQPIHRLYYQDAPTEDPIGHVAPELLDEKRVDVAMLCVGSSPQVSDAPGGILRAMAPRYALGGHWENFFRAQDKPLKALPFHDMEEYNASAIDALGVEAQPEMLVDDEPQLARYWLPVPGTRFEISPETAVE